MVRALGSSIDRAVPIHGPPFAWRALEAAGPAPPTPDGLGLASTIADIAADPRGRVILDAHVPGLTTHPGYETFNGQTLAALAPNSGGQISPNQVRQVGEDLAKPPSRTSLVSVG